MFSANQVRAGLPVLILIGLSCNPLLAQMTTGSISRTLVDASDAVVPNTAISLVSDRTGESRSFISGEDGSFLFSAIEPGVYSLSAEKQGFKKFKLTGITLSASQRLSVGNIKLQLGEAAQSVTVTQEGEAVSFESADTTGLVTDKQMDTLVTRGRDVMNLLRVLPGVNTIAM